MRRQKGESNGPGTIASRKLKSSLKGAPPIRVTCSNNFRQPQQELQLPAGGQDGLHGRYIVGRVKRAIILVNSEQLAVIKHRKPSQLGTQLFLNKIPPDCFVGLGTTVIINPNCWRSLGRLHTGRCAARRLLGLVAAPRRAAPVASAQLHLL